MKKWEVMVSNVIEFLVQGRNGAKFLVTFIRNGAVVHIEEYPDPRHAHLGHVA